MDVIDLERERSYPTPFANSPLLPLLLLSLLGQKHSPRTKNKIEEEYDFIIVGAGTAGSVLATRLAEDSCLRILVLEAGPSPPLLTDVPFTFGYTKTDVDWNFTTVSQKHSASALVGQRVIWPRGRMLGGSSLINAMLFVRGNRRDFDNWEKAGCKGWSYKDVLPYFKKLENYTDPEFRYNGYHGTEGPITVEKSDYRSDLENSLLEAFRGIGYKRIDVNGPTQTGIGTTHVNVLRGQRCSPLKVYLAANDRKHNLDVVKDAHVTKIIFEGKTATGVEFNRMNCRRRVRAKREVILSAGTTSTPQILMLSGVGPKQHLRKHGIPVIADLPVGQNLQDHPSPYVTFQLNRNITVVRKTFEEYILEYISNKTGLLAFPLGTIGPALVNSRYANPKLDFPDLMLYFTQISASYFLGVGLLPSIYNKYYKPYENSTLYVCNPHLQHPLSRGHIELKSADPYEPPLIEPNYLASPFDLDVIADGMRICHQVMNSGPMKRLGSKPLAGPFPGCEKFFGNKRRYYMCWARALISTNHHHVGTCKMGDPKHRSTVVDPKLRVKGLSGLRVVDASVMPVIVTANTHAATIMIAEKASDILKEDISRSEDPCFD